MSEDQFGRPGERKLENVAADVDTAERYVTAV